MPYPNIEGKYGFPAIYSPQDVLRQVGTEEDLEFPIGIIFNYQTALISHISRLGGSRGRYEGLQIIRKDVSVHTINGMGAPYAAVVMEEFIARGAQRFLNIGIAGALQTDLQIGDIVVCTRAIRDEGVSHHYLKPGRYVDLSADLTKKLKEELKNKGLRFLEGNTWTTDAPYRETKEEVRQYQHEGVLTVEMETAALASVAQYRGVEFSAAFVISDLLGDLTWKSGLGKEEVMNGLISLYQAAVSTLD